MATRSTSTEGMPHQTSNTSTHARYTRMAVKNKWEEQGFFFDESLENYGLDPTIYRRLSELGWFRFTRQPARANINWVLEFYTNNADGEDNITFHGRRVAANSATINNILGLPNNDPNIYALSEDSKKRTTKPSKTSSASKAPTKLWNTFVKRNLMPTSHNQTFDCTRLVLIHVIMTGYHFNVGDVIAQEIAAAFQNGKGILAFPCIISALCRRAVSSKVYMRKMDVANATPIKVALPTPPTSPAHFPAAALEEAGPSAPAEAQPSPAATPQASPIPNHTSTPAAMPASRQTTLDSPLEALPLQILQLRSQLQRIEARQLHFQEETKVFLNTLKSFLCFQFPSTAAFFTPQSVAMPPANHSTAAHPIPSTDPLVPESDTEEVHLSSDDENDIFECSTTQQTKSLAPAVREVPILSPAPTPATIDSTDRSTPDASTKRKGKTTVGRTVTRTAPYSSDQGEQMATRPAKR
ncbi:hypothetical protein GQ457_10G008750 [Hibiscus cannabinus]